VAYAQETGVPIAVPHNCNQYESAKLKMLFFITISRICRKRVEGKLVGRFLSFVCKKFEMDVSPVVISMLVYIDFASAVNSSALSGMWIFFRLWMSVVESFK
jgi:hypothetical protein